MHGNVSILLAEDNNVVRRSMSEFLLKLGYFVVEATTGAEALRLFREIRPHLIITDLRMPELDGIQFLKIVKEESELTPFIIVSGQGTMQDVIEGLRMGAWDYLPKPIHPLELLKHSVERALERAQLLRESRDHQGYLEKAIEQRTADLLVQNRMLEREIRQRQAQEELVQEARNEWERTVNALPDMIAIVDLEHRVIRLNTAMQERLGRPLAEIIGQDCLMCRDAFPCLHAELIEDRKPRTIEIFDRDCDANYSLHVIPYYAADGELIGSVHVFHDMSEQKKSMKEKEILHAQLLQAHKLESVGQLASGIAHEINTPTQFVSSNVGFLDEAFADVQKIVATLVNADEQQILSGEVLKQALETADWPYLEKEIPMAIEQSREGLSRVAHLVRAMKEFSHPGGKEAEVVDINHLIEMTVTVARNEWKYSSEVQLELSPDLPGVFCLADQIGQVFLNLLVNAAHTITEKLGRTPEGGKGIITIKTEVDGPSVLIHFSDTGCGIPDFARAKIFDPFFTTKAVGSGTGQGLAIAYDVVTSKHNGSLTFTTAVGEGTTFTIRLPIKKSVS
ncbi:MAG: response regulator [Desulfoprunum sp.]|nr:response regulator [Desulfoprunum sp.]